MKTVKFVNETGCFMIFENEVNTLNVFVNKMKLETLNASQLELLRKYAESLVNHYVNIRKQDLISNMLEDIIDGKKVFINSNGSKWYGQAPDDIETLLNVLETQTLDPTFEKYGNFYKDINNGIVSFFGNFYGYSHVFNIVSLDHSVNEKLINAIEKNKKKDSYTQAKNELLACGV